MGEARADVAFELFVEPVDAGQLPGIALLTVGQRHRLHVLPLEHEAQRAVVVYRQHPVEVVRIILHRPADMGVFTEPRVEAVVNPPLPQERRTKARALERVA